MSATLLPPDVPSSAVAFPSAHRGLNQADARKCAYAITLMSSSAGSRCLPFTLDTDGMAPAERLRGFTCGTKMRSRCMQVVPAGVRMSDQLVWQIIRGHNAFVRKGLNGLVLSAEKGNLYNKHSYKYSGEVFKAFFCTSKKRN